MVEAAPSAPKRGEGKRLRRIPSRGWVAGVCAGIAEFADVDKMVVRALYVLGTLVTLVIPGTLAYVIMWAVIPPQDTAVLDAPAAGRAR